ncbi:peroxisomal membrane protein PMP34-like isoform X2 [Physella acuta]|uniref:peroxisomal membrane protein PMP34-like isoform X2 n=1 Tax=Physella acuta TaxID=109671 RepID=UPI0027DDF2FA|nr:peroxisomal membrane protein PMP34-like isoform X2 [Physella acuta]
MMDGLSEKAAGLRSLFSYSNLVHAISGATGSVIAISVFYPLDTVRTRLQVDDHRCAKNTFHVLREIIQEEGLEGVYLGWFPVVTALCCSNFVYFYTYNGMKSAIVGKHKKASPLADLSMAFISGVVNVLVTTPLWVANTRLKLQGAKLHTAHYNKKDGPNKSQYCRYKGIVDCILKIIRSEGVKKLWGGTVASLLLATNPAIQFMIYEALKRYFKRFFNVAELSGLMYFILGAIAKASATVITYPLQVVQSRLRAGYAKVESSQTLRQNIIHLVKKNGLGALYKGMEAKLLQTILTAALMFVIYEKVAALIFRLMGIASK